jgi:hypothetical protein
VLAPVACAALVCAACASTKPSDDDIGAVDASVTPFTEEAMRAAATAYNTKVCAAFAKCNPSLFAIQNGSMATCVGADVALADLTTPYGYGSVLTPATLRACADVLDLSTCEALVRYDNEAIVPTAECRPLFYGSLPDGSACARGNQCASGRCFPPLGALVGSCGVCVPQEAVGARCQFYFGCAEGSTCRGATTATASCTKFGQLGESCGSYRPCRFDLLCSQGLCVAPSADDACDPSVGCATVPARFCNPTTKKCEDFVPVGRGEPCGPIPDRPFTFCSYGSTCTLVPAIPGAGADAGDSDAGPPPQSYVCTPRIELGRPCNVVAHPFDEPCMIGRCYQEKCRRRGPAACSPPAVPP